MGIVVAGFDIHRAQITFDALDRNSGQLTRGSGCPRGPPIKEVA